LAASNDTWRPAVSEQDTIQVLDVLDQIELLANGDGDIRPGGERKGQEKDATFAPVARLIKELRAGIAGLREQLPAEVRNVHQNRLPSVCRFDCVGQLICRYARLLFCLDSLPLLIS
jgi:hypothetical protein